MAKPITISTQAPSTASMNYQQLRQEAIQHIQQLAGKVWTDHNTHDPGITMLEILSYAITDLGYRTDYAIEDILASKKTAAANNFFSPATILSNRPLTINDYRQLIIDMPAVKNAWLKTLQDEIELADKTQLVGLYNVYLELEKHPKWGDLNKRTIKTQLYYGNTDNTNLHILKDNTPRLDIEISIIENIADKSTHIDSARNYISLTSPEKWAEIEAITAVKVDDSKGKKLVNYGEFRYSHQANLILDVKTKNQQNKDNITKRRLQIRFDLLQNKYLDNFVIRRDGIGQFIIADEDEPNYEKNNQWFLIVYNNKEGVDFFNKSSEKFIIKKNTYEETIIYFLEKRFIDFLNYEYLPKQIHISKIIDNVQDKLHQNRNLCEDFNKISIANIQEIAISAHIDIFPKSKTEKVLAEIVFQLNNFLLPNINRYTIEQLLNQDKNISEIFEGPILKHGFFDEQELLKENKSALYISNIINIIMDNESVIETQNLSLSHYVEGLIQARQNDKETREQLQLYQKGFYIPRVSIHKSKFIFRKNKMEVAFGVDIAEKELEKIHSHSNFRSSLDMDIAIPTGENLDIESYFSIQNDFSPIYGIGYEGVGDLPVQAGYENRMKRQIQARQLKTYLLFFEQLLANYLQQLANTAELFSMLPNKEEQTYFFRDFAKTEDDHDIIPNLNLKRQELIKKDTFFLPKLKDIVEDEDTYLSRKNTFLNHLLARFSENFVDYSYLLYSINQEKSQEIIEVINTINKKDIQKAFKNIFARTEVDLNSEMQRRIEIAIIKNIELLVNSITQKGLTAETAIVDGLKQIFGDMAIENIPNSIQKILDTGIKNRKVEELLSIIKSLNDTNKNTNTNTTSKNQIKSIIEGIKEWIKLAFIKQVFSEEEIKNIPDAITQAIATGIAEGIEEVEQELKKRLLLSQNYTLSMQKDMKEKIRTIASASFEEVLQGFIAKYEMNTKKSIASTTINLIDNLLQQSINSPKTNDINTNNIIIDTLDKISETVQLVLKEEIEKNVIETIKVIVFKQHNRAIEKANKDTQRQLIEQKSTFLQQYPIISSDRGQAASLTKKELAFNLSGLQKRIYLLLDFKNSYVQQLKAKMALVNGNKIETKTVEKEATDEEFFYVIEHILLRKAKNKPHTEEAAAIETYLLKLLNLKEVPEDFYSMQATIILPSWPERFKNSGFKKLLEEYLRLEAPAHILLYMVWLNEEQMEEFKYITRNYPLFSF